MGMEMLGSPRKLEYLQNQGYSTIPDSQDENEPSLGDWLRVGPDVEGLKATASMETFSNIVSALAAGHVSRPVFMQPHPT
jgi:hypothetical protein